MGASRKITVYIGYDSRESACSHVAAHSIRRRTHNEVNIHFLSHRELRKAGWFSRPWMISPNTGDYVDLLDSSLFNTEYSYTRFLVPSLSSGWVLYIDGDIIFNSDIKHLFKLCDDKYAVMVVKHRNQAPQNAAKLDGRLNQSYFRKNWSSMILWNCDHPSNKGLTKERVNFMRGIDLHTFSWLRDDEIGSLPTTHNFISGVSPRADALDSIHYTEGGPWMQERQNVMYADRWIKEYEEWQREADHGDLTMFPTMKYDRQDPTRKTA